MNIHPEVAAMTTYDFKVDGANYAIPCAIWLPADSSPRGLVLAGHGGSQHKRSDSVCSLVRRLVGQFSFAVVSIDGPIHGERNVDSLLTPKDRQRRFLELWHTGDGHVPAMVRDWRTVIDTLRGRPDVGDLPVGYAGVSMGTAYGLPLIAAEPRIEAAVLGMWSANYPCGDRLLQAAPDVRCPVLFIARYEDEIFDRAGTQNLFDEIGAQDKRMLVLPGKHVESEEQLDQMASFLNSRLGAGEARV
jgi:hypothetical protein